MCMFVSQSAAESRWKLGVGKQKIQQFNERLQLSNEIRKQLVSKTAEERDALVDEVQRTRQEELDKAKASASDLQAELGTAREAFFAAEAAKADALFAKADAEAAQAAAEAAAQEARSVEMPGASAALGTRRPNGDHPPRHRD